MNFPIRISYFTEEILNEKIHFCGVYAVSRDWFFLLMSGKEASETLRNTVYLRVYFIECKAQKFPLCRD